MIDFEKAKALVSEMFTQDRGLRKYGPGILDRLARIVVEEKMKAGDTLIIHEPNEYVDCFTVMIVRNSKKQKGLI